MRRNVLPYLLCLLCLDAQADSRPLATLDSHSQLLCASAMLYFDPHERSADPRSLTAVFYHLNSLEAQVLQLGHPPELEAPVQAMQRLFSELEKLPSDQRQRYPALIGQLLEQQRRVHAFTDLALQQPEPSDQQYLFGEQSRALAALLLDHQLRSYPLPQKEVLLMPAEQLVRLDSDIERRFELLQTEHPQQAPALNKIRNGYHFVRRQLQQGHGEGSGGVEFYLSRAVLDLDELALSLDQTAP